MLGVGLSVVQVAVRKLLGGTFTPAALFTTGVNGAWYDPSDFSTMFQDAAGTTPVTAVGQPVGLMLDKSNGMVLGPEIITNGSFNNGLAGWTSGAFGSAVLQDGGAKIERSSDSVTNTALVWLASVSATARYQITFDVLSGSGTMLLNGSVNVAASAGTKKFITTASSASSPIELRCFTGSFAVVDNISVRELHGNHAFNPSGNSANFPVLQQDGTGRYYLAFNGVNQWLQTNSIDFTYGDKMFVSAGVRKLSDAATSVLFELSAIATSNSGSFYVSGPDSAGANKFSFLSTGTISASASTGNSNYSAPVTTVISGIGSVSAPNAALRVNGTQVAQSTAAQGTGNYGNYPLYIGARAGTSLWFNGRLYGLVIAGKQASASEIASTETWLNQKTGAY